MKKTISIILASLLILLIPVQAFAVNETEKVSFESIAKNIIEKEDDSNATVYKNIEDFVKEAKKSIPNFNELELAKFIMDYTGQDYNSLPNDIILRTLNYKEIVTSNEYIKVSQDGEATYLTQDEIERDIIKEANKAGMARSTGTWKSPNGYMKIGTSASVSRVTEKNKYYEVSVKCNWLKIPKNFFQDVLVINHTGTYDNKGEKYGFLKENISCCTSSHVYNDYAKNSKSGKNVKFEYPSTSTVAIRFKLISAKYGYTCPKTSGSHIRSVTNIEAYLRYNVILKRGSHMNVQGAYCHKQLAIGSISIGISGSGISFSPKGKTVKKDYKAEPIRVSA